MERGHGIRRTVTRPPTGPTTRPATDHDGKRIYLCCRGCIGAVKKDPAKYVAAMESEGIVLEKVPAAAK
jgi:hypothetical protein